MRQSFEGYAISGLNLRNLYTYYTNDPYSGDLCTDCVGYCKFLIDPYFKKQDLYDCSFFWRRRWVNKVEAKELLP